MADLVDSLATAMGFPAWAMLFDSSDEIVPETCLRDNERVATLGTIIGVVVMLYLDISLGEVETAASDGYPRSYSSATTRPSP